MPDETKSSPTIFTKIISSVKNNKFISSFVLETTPKDKKSEAHIKSDERADAFAKALAAPIIKLKNIEQNAKQEDSKIKVFTAKVAATAYKAVAGMIIDPKKLSETTKNSYEENSLTSNRKAYSQKWNEAKGVTGSAKVVGEFLAKEPLRAAVDAAQFIVRNTIKQPAMMVFRAGALVNNAAQYGYASARKALASTEKKDEWDKVAKEQKENTKYQAGKLLVATVATAAMAAMDASLVATAGGIATIPAAMVVVGTAADALHYAVTGAGAASSAYDRVKPGENHASVSVSQQQNLAQKQTVSIKIDNSEIAQGPSINSEKHVFAKAPAEEQVKKPSHVKEMIKFFEAKARNNISNKPIIPNNLNKLHKRSTGIGG